MHSNGKLLLYIQRKHIIMYFIVFLMLFRIKKKFRTPFTFSSHVENDNKINSGFVRHF